MKGFRAGLHAGLRAEKPKKPLSKKEKDKLRKLLAKQKVSEEIY